MNTDAPKRKAIAIYDESIKEIFLILYDKYCNLIYCENLKIVIEI